MKRHASSKRARRAVASPKLVLQRDILRELTREDLGRAGAGAADGDITGCGHPWYSVVQ
jgi:hypothetical protein